MHKVCPQEGTWLVNRYVRPVVILPERRIKSCHRGCFALPAGDMTLGAICTYWGSCALEYAGDSDHNLCVRPDNSVIRDSRVARSMDAFLAEVERKAFVIARISLRDDDDALDAVQDAMIRLVRNYANRPRAEWKPLFYRILRNRIVDQQRRRGVRQRVMAWLPNRDGTADPVAEAPGRPVEQPDRQAELQESMVTLRQAIADLPERQRQAFLLRAMEGFNVAETATAMACSQGSVKTHYFRAVRSLRTTLGEHWGEHDEGRFRQDRAFTDHE